MRKRSLRWTDLADETFLMRERGSGTYNAIQRHLAEHGLELGKTFTIESNEAIKYAVVENLGISILSAYVLADAVAQNLVQLRVEEFPILSDWHVAYPSAKPLLADRRTLFGVHSQTRPRRIANGKSGEAGTNGAGSPLARTVRALALTTRPCKLLTTVAWFWFVENVGKPRTRRCVSRRAPPVTHSAERHGGLGRRRRPNSRSTTAPARCAVCRMHNARRRRRRDWNMVIQGAFSISIAAGYGLALTSTSANVRDSFRQRPIGCCAHGQRGLPSAYDPTLASSASMRRQREETTRLPKCSPSSTTPPPRSPSRATRPASAQLSC